MGSVAFLFQLRLEPKDEFDWEAHKSIDALANVLKDSALEESFLAGIKKRGILFSFEFWRLLCNRDILEKARNYALEEMQKVANSCGEWRSMYCSANNEHAHESAKRNILRTATSCWDWHWMLRRLPVSEHAFVISKMKKLAKSFHDFDILRESVSKDSEEYRYALSGMKSTAQSFDQWQRLRIYADESDYPLIIQKMHDTAITLYNLHSLWEYSGTYPEIRSTTWKRMRDGSFAFSKWQSLYTLYSTKYQPEIENLCLEKMKETASSLEDWSALHEVAKNNPEVRSYAIKMIAKLSTDCE